MTIITTAINNHYAHTKHPILIWINIMTRTKLENKKNNGDLSKDFQNPNNHELGQFTVEKT